MPPPIRQSIRQKRNRHSPTRVNGDGAKAIAAAALAMNAPVVQISTDYVFDGSATSPYREDHSTNPLGVYGASKLAGEQRGRRGNCQPRHFAHRVGLPPFGKNFVRTMLRLAQDRDEVSVVADQHGSPTSALDIADGIIAVCRNLLERPSDADLRGVFHMTAAGYTTWAEFAAEIFAGSAEWRRQRRAGEANHHVAISDPGAPPGELACSIAAGSLPFTASALPHWRTSLKTCVARLVGDGHVPRQESGR